MFDSWTVVILSTLTKLLTINSKLYFSTDFEVHRNWLAITQSVPFKEWYIESRNQWTLDYPPFFAYFEYILGLIARYVDPRITDINAIDYAEWSVILFQRLSVILMSDLVLAFAVIRLLPEKTRAAGLALAMFSSSLFLVDHIHFQYNGVLLGLLLLSIGFVEKGKFYHGAALYMLLIFFKHIYLSAAPVYLVYFLRQFVGNNFGRLLALAGIVCGITVLAIGPVLVSGQMHAMMNRLFPFGRGLVHSYWAPNFWALYVTTDRFLASLIGKTSVGSSPTAGLVGDITIQVLPFISPLTCTILSFSAYIPLLVLVWRNPQRLPFSVLVALGNAIVFWFGWHVHEKALMMVSIPLIMSTLTGSRIDRQTVWRIAALTCASLLPLLPRSEETVLKWAIAVGGCVLDSLVLEVPLSARWMVYVFGGEVYRVFCHERIFGPDRMQFLPLLLTSVLNAFAFFWSIINLVRVSLGSKEGNKLL
jgi:alpha-1,3-glucosyltransferase